MTSERVLRFQKWVIWAVFIGIVFVLRHLLAVIFLTFVLSYIGNTFLKLMAGRFPNRRLNLSIIYVVLLLLLTGIGVVVIPRMFAETRQLAMFYVSQDAVQGPATPQDGSKAPTIIDRQTRKYVDTILFQIVGGSTFERFQQSVAYEDLLNKAEDWIHAFIPRVVLMVRSFVNASIFLAAQFLLSIILSFLILWDLPGLKAGVERMSVGNTAEIYAEIAPSMSAFAVILGRAFEAQTGIALVNSILTSIGFLILGVPSIALLAMIVFFCSFIPVVGVMLSTLPAALFAFKAGGIGLVFGLVIMVLVVHAVEAYALNPIIYGRHLKMHPVVILAILMIGEHLFGVWGLLLGVPMAAFVRAYLIDGQRPAVPPTRPVLRI